MTILLLGGTADARKVADALHEAEIKVIYSIVGLVRTPKMDCQVLVGGFTQFGDLATYLEEKSISAILDVTHPYAQVMSNKAVLAAHACGIPCWRFHRPAWQAVTGDVWHEYQHDNDLVQHLAGYARPFLSAGQIDKHLLAELANLPSIEQVLWRTAVAPKFKLPAKVTWLKAIGPFDEAQEHSLIEKYQVDVIVSKNSGGDATSAKLAVARKLGLPVWLEQRPELLAADRQFSDLPDCIAACIAAWSPANQQITLEYEETISGNAPQCQPMK